MQWFWRGYLACVVLAFTGVTAVAQQVAPYTDAVIGIPEASGDGWNARGLEVGGGPIEAPIELQ